MIEVEKKFILNDEDKSRLTEGAEFLGERVFTDLYYDKPDYSLTKKDQWLRARKGKWQFKVPLFSDRDRLVDQYDEIEDEQKIMEMLGFSSDLSLEDNLKQHGYEIFCACTSTRRKFKKGDFIFDLDRVDFEEFSYDIGEIELMVEKKEDIKLAIEKILNLAENLSLKIALVRGKVVEYLRRIKPEHYKSLVEAGVIRE